MVFEELSALLDCSPLPVLATEGHSHTLQYANPALRMLLASAADATLGTPLVQDDADRAVLDRVYSTGVAEVAVHLGRVFGANSNHLPCSVWPILGHDNLPAGLLIQVAAQIRDALTRNGSGLADELLDANERLLVAGLRAQEQADVETALRGKAEAALTMRDEFMSVAAHELRTPVTGIKLSAQLALRALEQGTSGDGKTARQLLGILTGASRLELLINDLMDVSRMRNGQLLLRVAPIDLAALVTTIALRYAETTGELHQVTIDAPPAPMMVAGDAGRLEQILDNLLSNAIKYSPAGGEIGVKLRHAVDGAVLIVSDTGIGLPPGQHERIFEPFGRAANATRQGLPGMGLGLHICRQIAEAHGGRMWAESDGEDLGMTISMWLPSVTE